MELLKPIVRLFLPSNNEKKGKRRQRNHEPVESESGMYSPRPQTSPPSGTNAAHSSRRKSFLLGQRQGGAKYTRERERRATAENVVSSRMNERHRRESARINELDELKQSLIHQREQLQGSILKLKEENARKREELEALEAQEDAWMAEDELFQMRERELESANAVIVTHDRVPGELIRQEVKELNKKISQLASYAGRIPREFQRGTADRIKSLLGEEYTAYFKGSESVVGSNGLVLQAILQIYLARHCASFSSSWHQENADINHLLDYLYYHISNREDPRVAGKWRELTFTEYPNGIETEALKSYAATRTDEFIEILSNSGRKTEEHQTQEIGHAMLDVMRHAETIRVYTKGRFISADLQPYVAAYKDKFDSSTMRDESQLFGMGAVDEDDRHRFVLGSTGVGLRAIQKGRGVSLDAKACCRPTVVLIGVADRRKGRRY